MARSRLDPWRERWASIVGGLRGKPAARAEDAQAAFEAAVEASGIAPLRMTVLDGRHRGAVETFLVPRILIGSSTACDVVLSDPGILARHIELWHLDGNWRIRDLASAAEVELPVERTGRRERMHVACGPVHLRFDAKPLPRTRGPDRSAARAIAMSVATGTAFTALLMAGVYWERVWTAPSSVDLITQAANDLSAAGFPEVRADLSARGGLALAGYVADEAQAARLQAWQQTSAYRDARNEVLVMSRLVDRLQQDFATDGIRMSYLGRGALRAEGSTRRMELKQRLHDFEQALQGRVSVDDRVAYIEEAAKLPGKPRPLPFRIVNVMVAEPAYFQTDAGSRYFIGSVMPDGTLVESIDARRVVFRQGNTEVVYPLG